MFAHKRDEWLHYALLINIVSKFRVTIIICFFANEFLLNGTYAKQDKMVGGSIKDTTSTELFDICIVYDKPSTCNKK